MDANLHEIFLRLVRLGIGHTDTTEITEKVDWVALKALADRQGLSAVVLDGLNTNGTSRRQPESYPSLLGYGRGTQEEDKVNLTNTMPKMVRLQWIGDVLQNYEGRFDAYRKAIGSLAGWYNAHGFRMMVLKGYACALDWPKHSHRPCGDIDIWLFGKQEEADAVLRQARKSAYEIENSHHHHTVFLWKGFMVENHYDFINVHHHRSNGEYEKILKELGADDSHSVEVCGDWVYLPSANLHALFLMKHMMLHFASGEITLRQLLDWAFFVEKHGGEVDWPMVLEVFDRFGMRQLFDIFNAMCVEDLGFFFNDNPNGNKERETKDEGLKERVLNEILFPEFSEKEPKGLLPRVSFKYRRWKANGWKHELCYKESMWSAFWSGVWNHLLKPASI